VPAIHAATSSAACLRCGPQGNKRKRGNSATSSAVQGLVTFISGFGRIHLARVILRPAECRGRADRVTGGLPRLARQPALEPQGQRHRRGTGDGVRSRLVRAGGGEAAARVRARLAGGAARPRRRWGDPCCIAATQNTDLRKLASSPGKVPRQSPRASAAKAAWGLGGWQYSGLHGRGSAGAMTWRGCYAVSAAKSMPALVVLYPITC